MRRNGLAQKGLVCLIFGGVWVAVAIGLNAGDGWVTAGALIAASGVGLAIGALVRHATRGQRDER